MTETAIGQQLDTPGRVRAILAEHLSPMATPAEDIREDDTLDGTFGADSLDMFELALALEDEFDIDVMHEDLIPIITVGDLIDFVTAEIAEKEKAR